MAAIERKINGTFAPVPGGYAQQINEQTTLFVPEFTVARYDTETGELFGHAPDYEALEAAKSPAVHADKPGEYSYCYEMEKAPTGCDFSASLSYYGKHYYLRPLRDDLPQLRGRGISYDEQRSTYTVARRAELSDSQFTAIRSAHNLFNGGSSSSVTPYDLALCDYLTLDIITQAMYIWKCGCTISAGQDGSIQLDRTGECQRRGIEQALFQHLSEFE
jgi:hypothetical protein